MRRIANTNVPVGAGSSAGRHHDAQLVVNFDTSPAALPVEETEILFETESGADLSDGVLSLPGHAGALLR
jgi:hypothetical protein